LVDGRQLRGWGKNGKNEARAATFGERRPTQMNTIVSTCKTGILADVGFRRGRVRTIR
jgi:hypothetical protein